MKLTIQFKSLLKSLQKNCCLTVIRVVGKLMVWSLSHFLFHFPPPAPGPRVPNHQFCHFFVMFPRWARLLGDPA